MSLRFVMGFLVIFGFSAMTFAQSSSTSAPPAAGSSTSLLKKALSNKTFEDTHQITDAKLKAEDGSLSRYSMKFNLSYYGPTLGDLRAADQPNPDGSLTPNATAIGGSMSGRYRINSSSAISLGTGIKALHPFHGMDRTDVNNPYVSYDMSTRFESLQMRNSPGISAVTIPTYTKAGEYGGLTYDNSLVYSLGESRFALSLDSNFGYYLYNRGYVATDKNASRISISVSPGLKYNFSDKLSLTTSYGLGWWNLRKDASQSVLLPRREP